MKKNENQAIFILTKLRREWDGQKIEAKNNKFESVVRLAGLYRGILINSPTKKIKPTSVKQFQIY